MPIFIVMIAILTLFLMTADPRSDATSTEQKQHSAWQQQDQSAKKVQSEQRDDVEQS